jgi:hypothetical protein
MPRGKASGYSLTKADVAIVLGMQARGDRDHDIAAWFGVNQGRVAEAKDGKFGKFPPAPADALPPKGAPGIKGRRLRWAVGEILGKKGAQNVADVLAALKAAAAAYDKHEA